MKTGKRHIFITFIMIISLFLSLSSPIYANEELSNNQRDDNVRPELTVAVITAGSSYDAMLINVPKSAYQYVVMKVWAVQDRESDAHLFLGELQNAEAENDYSSYLAHISIQPQITPLDYFVEAYGVNETELVQIDSEEKITVEMLSDEEMSSKIEEATFNVAAPEKESESVSIDEEECIPEKKVESVPEKKATPSNDTQAIIVRAPKAAAKAPETPQFIQGIDVSKHNGEIDWEKVKASGVKYAIIRCGYGDNITSQDDIRWTNNVIQCEKLGIPYGVYIYSYATTVKQAQSEADHCLRLLIGHKPNFPIYYDLEDKCMQNLSNASLAIISQAWATKIQKAGYAPGVYSSKYWWTNRLTSPIFNNYYRWVAQWNTTCTYTGTYQMWQYSSEGSVDGIDGNVDMNYWYGQDLTNSKAAPLGKVVSGWQKEGKNWYYLYSSGLIATGWQSFNGKWYYFDQSYGVMQIGWHRIGGKWYYLNNDGIMQTGWKYINKKWYYLESNGAMVTGWKKLRGTWYFLTSSGAMATGWQRIGGVWYYLKSSGAMATGWQKIGGVWYYLKSSGAMATGWQKVNGKWYYLTGSGAMATGTITIGGKRYRFASSGAWIR